MTTEMSQAGEGTDHADALADALAGVQRLVRRRLRRELDVTPMRGAQIELLRLVAARPGIGVSAAARELHLANNSVSTLVNQLSGAGYLRRETDPDDRRSAVLLPTPEATERLAAWASRRGALMREQLARLTVEDRAALVAAVPALTRLARNLYDEYEEGERA
ncbi:MarR family transcriptional regulator [Streptomyces sp. NBC_01317]|uniref:MarR family winged helix-turn-helix transcriptional regulator n=1 Tax=Streptomyces sp. NBC_01317 TaxID=2903822 RepID=UPI002E13A205|nr:MarR family transcriptional regulator [Streptomyces sp. NBC_01317]